MKFPSYNLYSLTLNLGGPPAKRSQSEQMHTRDHHHYHGMRQPSEFVRCRYDMRFETIIIITGHTSRMESFAARGSEKASASAAHASRVRVRELRLHERIIIYKADRARHKAAASHCTEVSSLVVLERAEREHITDTRVSRV